jgi:CheY-like chemotaxis protein
MSMYLKDFNKKITFLIIDDETTILSTLEKDLRALGFEGEIKAAMSGIEGLEVLENKVIDIVLCDFYMPGMSGLEVLKTVREDREFENLPFLMLTSSNMIDTVTQCIDEGVSNYVVKPWDKDDLYRRIRAA